MRRVELQPLDSSASLELARQLLEKARLRGTAITPDEIVGEAGGHPLYIDELVRHAALSVESSERPAGRVRLEDAIWMRASHLPPTARKLLELVAVAGAPLGAETIRYAAEVSQASFAKELGLLRVAKLVRSSGSLGPSRSSPTTTASASRCWPISVTRTGSSATSGW